MLLVELTINSTLFRLSKEGIALENWWDNQVLSFSSPQLRVKQIYGGYAEMQFGSITLFSDLFTSDWPPPFSCPVQIKYTGTTEAAAETLFSGTCHLSRITREGVTYQFYGDDDGTEIADSTVFDDTLDDVVDWFCDAARLNLTLDTTKSRGTSPDVDYTTSGDQVALKLLSDICAFYSHCFYIKDSTLYLVDMLQDNGSRTITEYDFMPSEYYIDSPVAEVKGSETDYVQISSYTYGNISSVKEYCSNQTDVETALSNILNISNKFRCRLKTPFAGSVPSIGEKITWTDTSLGTDIDAYIRCRAVQYNFDSEEIIIEGEGVLS